MILFQHLDISSIQNKKKTYEFTLDKQRLHVAMDIRVDPEMSDDYF